MAGQRNKNAFKFLLQLLILSQKHILGVKKVVWDGLDVVWGGLEVVWGGLGCFGVGLPIYRQQPTTTVNNRQQPSTTDSRPTTTVNNRQQTDNYRQQVF